MIVKRDKSWRGYYYIHEESGLLLAHDSRNYKFNIKYSLEWLRKYRKNLTNLTSTENDKNRKKNIE